MEFIETLCLIMLGLAGYFIFYIINFPTPALVGSLVIVIALRLLGLDLPAAEPYLNTFVQILLGLYVGVELTRGVLKHLAKIVFAALPIMIWALAITFLVGRLLYLITDIDLITAYLSATPGGLAETSIMALAMGANVGVVSLLQLFRMLLTLIFYPFLIQKKTAVEFKSFVPKLGIIDAYRQSLASNLLTVRKKIADRKIFHDISYFFSGLQRKTVLTTGLIAILGGSIGNMLPIPVGAMLGALFIVSIATISQKINMEAPPSFLRKTMQVGIGVSVGSNFLLETFNIISGMILPILVFTFVIFGSSLLMSYLIRAITGWDHATCLMATAPAGFTSLTILAAEYNCRALEVSMLQLTRILTVKAMIPIVLALSMS